MSQPVHAVRDRIRFWLKGAVALVLGAIIYCAANPSPELKDLSFGYKTLLIGGFGTAAQRESVVEEAGRRIAAENGNLQLYEARRAFREALEAQRRLAEIDEGLADYAIRAAAYDLEARRAPYIQRDPPVEGWQVEAD